jgi:choline dehydrogenase-like flavoprotein
MSTTYDVIIIGTGAGGGTLARHLASSGKAFCSSTTSQNRAR